MRCGLGIVLGLLACGSRAPTPGASPQAEVRNRSEAAEAEPGSDAAKPGPESPPRRTPAGSAPDGATASAEAELEPEPSAPPSVPPLSNRADTLVAVADLVSGVAVQSLPDRKEVGRLPSKAVSALKKRLREGVADGLTSTSPPWDAVLSIEVEGHNPFVAHPVGFERARLNPTTPDSPMYADAEGRPDPDVLEVTVGEEVFEALTALLGPTTEKEYHAAPPRRRRP